MTIYAKSKLEFAMERFALRPERLGRPHLYSFAFPSIAAGITSQPVPVRVRYDAILLGLVGSPSDGAAASYAGLSLFFRYGDQDFCTDGQSEQSVGFAELFGRALHPSFDFEIPLLIRAGTVLVARVTNATGGALTPSLHAKVVELNP